MMSENTDMVCPWCGGELPGQPGQYVKCRHCGSDIVWRDGRTFKTNVQASFPNPIVREVPANLQPSTKPPPQNFFEPSPEAWWL